jgi:hypothetical protein
LQEGPTEAAPILDAITADQDNTLRDLVNASEQAIDQMNTHIREVSRLTFLATHSATDQMNKDFSAAMAIMEAEAASGGTATATALAVKLGLGVATVERISHEFGIKLAEGVNPVLGGVGAPTINTTSTGREELIGMNQSVGLTGYGLAQGGHLPDEAKYQAAGTMVQWAEPETGGEWFLPDAPAKRDRSLQVAHEMLDRWGYEIRKKEFAEGGFLAPEGVPTPPDLSKYGNVIGYTGDKVDRYIYDKVVEYVRAHQGGTGYGYKALIDYLTQQAVPFTVTSTTGGSHVDGSLHYKGLAADFVSANLGQIFDTFARVAPALQELFYDPAGRSVKLGKWQNWIVGGHSDHVHAATWAGPQEGPGLPTGRVPGAPLDASGAVALGRQMAAARGWTGAEWDALYALWQQESGWNPNAVNPDSGAYGIPQALPAAQGHPYALGDAQAQIAWGLNYIANRYGDPIAAENHEKADGWYAHGGSLHVGSYDQGGLLQPGLTLAYNGTGRPEHVTRYGDQPVVDRDAIARAIRGAVSSLPSAEAIGRAVGDALVSVLPSQITVDGRQFAELVSTALYKRGRGRGGMT